MSSAIGGKSERKWEQRRTGTECFNKRRDGGGCRRMESGEVREQERGRKGTRAGAIIRSGGMCAHAETGVYECGKDACCFWDPLHFRVKDVIARSCWIRCLKWHEICRTHGHTVTGTYDVSLTTTHQWIVEGATTTAATVVSEGQLPMLILHKMRRERNSWQREKQRLVNEYRCIRYTSLDFCKLIFIK